jgi:hypothetical protein
VDGQRWHLPKGVAESDIPLQDFFGDQLQAATTQVAGRWSRGMLSVNEATRIQMEAASRPWLSRILEAQAKGRWVETQVRGQFPQMNWSRTGADLIGPNGLRYDIMSATKYNLNLHARRMPDQLFRIIGF